MTPAPAPPPIHPDLRYPIGRGKFPNPITAEDRHAAIDVLAQFPEKLYTAVAGMPDEHLDTPYREGGWTVRQVVHHLADSHSMALLRIKMALTQDWPRLSGYDEKLFAELPDTALPVAPVLKQLEGIHARLVAMLEKLSDTQWKRGFNHAERGPTSVEAAALLYSWHSRHHLAHITGLRERMNW